MKKLLFNKKGTSEIVGLALLITFIILAISPVISVTKSLINQYLIKMDNSMKSQMTNGAYTPITPSVSITCPDNISGKYVDVTVAAKANSANVDDIEVSADKGASVTKLNDTTYRVNFTQSATYTIKAAAIASNEQVGSSTTQVKVDY